jgi:hypothetical protein
VGQRRQEWRHFPPVYLERGRLVTAAVMWKTQLESGGGSLPTLTVNKKKKMAIAKGGYSCILEKTKGTCVQENSK